MRFVAIFFILVATLASCKQKPDEVLESFGKINERLERINSEQQNPQFYKDQDSLLKGIEQRNPSEYKKLQLVHAKMQALDTYISNTKKSLLTTLKDPEDYSAMGTSTEVDELFFMGNQNSAEGDVFIQKIEQYRSTVETEFKEAYPEFVQKTNENFDISDVQNRNGITMPWLHFNYKGFPLIASLTKMTQLQADLKTNFQDLLLLLVRV
ncbi:hypothetical protein [Rasiella sp. SM2506]|uniref:hypothetical protein n=1 Tax=Rasiella sp. SM2506 TaxID=3423914 RepID=UPI003D79073E